MNVNKFLVSAKSIVFIGFSIFFISCNSSDLDGSKNGEVTKENLPSHYTEETLEAEIRGLEEKLNAPQVVDKNAIVSQLVDFYLSFQKLYPSNKKAPEMLFLAANMKSNQGEFKEAISLYEKVVKEYPQYIKVPECIFLEAFCYENNLSQYGMAREKYTFFLEKYPNHALAESAKISIQNLGKSDEEIIQQFEKNNP